MTARLASIDYTLDIDALYDEIGVVNASIDYTLDIDALYDEIGVVNRV